MTIREAISSITADTSKIDGAFYYVGRKSGVNENELSVLYMLNDGREHTQHQLSLELMTPKTTINSVIKSLRQKGIVDYDDNGNKEKALYLTEKGKAYADSLLSPIYEAEDRAMEKTLERYSVEFVEAFAFLSETLCEEFKKL